MKIILNFNGPKLISKSFGICKYWQPNSTRCLADFNTQVIINMADFVTPEKFVGFIDWMTRRISESNQINIGSAYNDQELSSNVESIQLNLDKDDMSDLFRNKMNTEKICIALEALLKQIKGEENSIKKFAALSQISVINRTLRLRERFDERLFELVSQV